MDVATRMRFTDRYHWQQMSQHILPESGKFVDKESCRHTIHITVRNFARIVLRLQLTVMDTSNRENEEIRVLDSETPRSSLRNTDIVPDIVQKLLAEVSNIRDENKLLRKEMEGLKAKRKTKLSQKARDHDSECSVSIYSYSLDFRPITETLI